MNGQERREMVMSMRGIEGSYKFGESVYKALKEVRIPCSIDGFEFNIITVVVEGEIPWLIGRETMAKMKIDLDVARSIVTYGGLGGVKKK